MKFIGAAASKSRGELHFVRPRLAGQAEGRSSNLLHVTVMIQPIMGGKRNLFLEINPETAAKRGIADGDRVRIRNDVGQIDGIARYFNGVRPDTVALPMIHGHWAQGRKGARALGQGALIRPEDIRWLSQRMLQQMAVEQGRPLAVSEAFMRDLLGRPWRGNARELRSHLEQAVVLSEAGMLDVDASDSLSDHRSDA